MIGSSAVVTTTVWSIGPSLYYGGWNDDLELMPTNRTVTCYYKMVEMA